MSTEEDSMELPDELKKLEIENSLLPPINIKLSDENLPVSLNPFFYQAKLATRSIEKTSTIDIFGPKCSCEINLPASNFGRRRSSSTGSYVSYCKSLFGKVDNSSTQIERNILNQTRFKSKNNFSCTSSGRKKFILRDPVLKKIQNCLHIKQNIAAAALVSKSRNKTSEGNINNSKDKFIDNCVVKCQEFLSNISDCPNLDNLRLEDENPSCINNLSLEKSTKVKKQTDKYLDFRNLIEECETLSNQCNFILDYGRNDSADNSNNINLKRNSKSKIFTTIQNRSKNNINSEPDRMLLLKDDLGYEEEIIEQNQLFPVGGSGSVANLQQQNNSGTTCSQQARINSATSNCDVTIDELASYFETFVHIPKKMSEMAEMMYI